MPAVKKTKNNISYGGGAIISNDVKNYDDDPLVIKKNEQAKIALSKLIVPGTNK